jgi:ubiquinone biosynthesis protein COQ4
MLLLRGARGLCSAAEQKLYENHVPTTLLQKTILGLGSSFAALADPWRSDMVAVNGEVTGVPALRSMRSRMQSHPEGRAVLAERPRISTRSVDFDHLRGLAPATLGHTYAIYSDYHQIHDVMHSVLEMPTNMVGEVAVKWVEALQTGLPMCIGGCILGPLRFTPRQVAQFRRVRPWAIKVGLEAEFFMNVFWEQRWEQSLVDFRREMSFDPPPPFK